MEGNEGWVRRMKVSSLTMVAAAAAAGSAPTALSVAAPQQGTVTDGLSFVAPRSSSCAARTPSPTTRPATAALSSSAAVDRTTTSAHNLQLQRAGPDFGAVRFSANWLKRHEVGVVEGGLGWRLQAEAGDSSESAEGATMASSVPKGERGQEEGGGGEEEEQSVRQLEELDNR